MQALPVVNFHGIGAPARDLETGEAPFWLDFSRFTDVLDLIAARPPGKRARITFDDGNSSDLAIAVPELRRRGLEATFFILTGRLGRHGSLDGSDVRDLLAAGMLIGSHGIAHRDLTGLDAAVLQDELVRSRAALEGIAEMPVNRFSVPFGRYNTRVLNAIRQAGYTSAATSDGGTARPSAFLQPRRSLRNDMTLAECEAVLDGRASVARRMRRFLGMTLKRLR
jgi:peptidoglycan/xylan/chitin deacetylase (PgdA/CDA1 family)